MAISWRHFTYSMLPEWARYNAVGYAKFNQVSGTGVPVDSCLPWIQKERDNVGRALYTAYNAVHKELKFPIRPTWLTDYIPLRYGEVADKSVFQLSSGFVQALGLRTVDVIQAGATVTYSDEDGDGVDETATISVVTAVALDEIEVFFQVADGAPTAAHQHYQIVPLEKTKSGGTVTITGSRWDFVKPSIWEDPFVADNQSDRNTADTGTAGDFVTAVDVYRIHADTTNAGDLVGCEPAGQVVTVSLVDDRNGVVEIKTAPDCTEIPDQLVVHYLAGYPLDNYRPVEALATAVIRYANVLMSSSESALCQEAQMKWKEDRLSTDLTESEIEDNPFGVRIGAVEALRTVKQWAKACDIRPRKRWERQL